MRRFIADRWPAGAVSKGTFNRDFAAWQASGGSVCALVDKRAEANGGRALLRLMPAEDMDLLVSYAARQCWAQVEPAWDALMSRTPEQGGFSLAMRARKESQGRLPDSIRAHASARARASKDFIHQPRAAGNSAASAILDHSGTMAGDWYGADDITPEPYFYIPDGAGWWTLTRGQFLFIHDERSKKILDFILIPEKGFSGANSGCD